MAIHSSLEMHLQKLQQDTVLASFSWTHSLFQPRSLPREHTGAAYPEEGLLTIWDTHRANLPMAFTEHTHGGTDFWEEGLKKKKSFKCPLCAQGAHFHSPTDSLHTS